MSATEALLKNNEKYAASFDQGNLGLPPAKKIAVVACMDARLNPSALLGLSEGDAHVIRNAGGVVNDDVIRSLSISQHLLGTEEIMFIKHTDCGMLTFTDDEFADKLEQETGQRPSWNAQAFSDLEKELRSSLKTVRESPFILNRQSIRGFVYDVESGSLREVGA